MARRTTINQSEDILTELIVDREEFKSKLNERIRIGEEILNRSIQTNEDFEKMKTNFEEWIDYNLEYLKQSFNNPYNEYKKAFDHSGYSFYGGLNNNTNNPLQEKKDIIIAKIQNLNKLVAKVDLLKSSMPYIENIQSTSIPSPNKEKNEVFIVHGHEEESKLKTARFIEKLGFKPIILNEQANGGKTIIEKIEEYSNVGFGIVLYTPCDIGGEVSDSPVLKARARQNVIFEHGFLIGKIGRENVCALVKGVIEKPNDISGVVYIPLDDSNAWQIKIAQELKKSGYKVDFNKII